MEQTIKKILLLEDNPAEATAIRKMLLPESKVKEFSVQNVQYLADALKLLEDTSFDCILADLGLPDSEGLETALALRGRDQKAPIVVFTALDDEAVALKSLELDVQDYLIKGEITAPLLVRAIRYAMQRKRMSEELHQSQGRFRALVLASSQALYRMSPDWSEMVDLKSGDFLASTETSNRNWLQDYIPPGDQPHIRAVIQDAIRSKSVFDLEHRVRRVDGTVGWALSRAVPVMDANGEIMEWFGAASDITKRKQLEKDLEARATELVETNRELQTFNYSVAHDLRQPLNIINGYCQALEMLCGDRLDKECAGYLQGTYEGTLRMSNLIEALLNFSHLSHVELHRELVDLSKMARELAEGLRVTNPERPVTFQIADGVMVDGDPDLLRAALDNVIGNAWKYTAIRVEAIIEFGAVEIDGRTACFIRDNGSGFDMADADKLFLPFKCLSGAEETRGFGIGLATVERIIKRHGGRIWAEGEPDKGATFWFTLPAEPEST